MNDRSLCLLDNYDIEVLRTRKGRGAILCETNLGILTFKEYTGYKERILFQDSLLTMLKERDFPDAECILKNKDGELLSQDTDGTYYVLKTYFEGRECNVRDMEECREAVKTLAAYHHAARMEEPIAGAGMPKKAYSEFEKRNRELKRVKKYLKDRGQKTDFELYLMKTYDYFLERALQITAEAISTDTEESDSYICHGDYQHHNIVVSENGMKLINFEKCVQDSPVRDLYLFMRKLLEKTGWEEAAGFELMKAYEIIRELTCQERQQLYFRLAYPEKFWKIVNFYYNSGKSWIPGKNLEKLKRVTELEKYKQEFLEKYRFMYGL